jgi:hypothetical protein
MKVPPMRIMTIEPVVTPVSRSECQMPVIPIRRPGTNTSRKAAKAPTAPAWVGLNQPR